MKALNNMLGKLEAFIIGFSLAVATALTFIEVILRYFFGSSLGFTHELVIYLLIITGLIGAAFGVQKKVHIGVDLLIQQFPYPVQKAVVILTHIGSVLFCAIITVLGTQQVQIMSSFGQVTPELEIPLFIPLLIVPISFGLMTIHFIQELMNVIKTPKEKLLQQEEGVY